MTTDTTTLRDVPLSRLIPSEKNVRRTGRDAGIEALAARIAAHGLLQSLAVQPVRDAEGTDTGKFKVTGGGRRLAASKWLAKRKRTCIVTEGDAEEISLAENVMREAPALLDRLALAKLIGIVETPGLQAAGRAVGSRTGTPKSF